MIGPQTIYELRKVSLIDYKRGSSKNIINCSNVSFGFFDSVISVEEFIKKHNYDMNCFFISRAWVFNPIHYGQTGDYLSERTYDCDGNIICDCPTHHFIVNFRELGGDKRTIFIGRSPGEIHRGDDAWFYDQYNNIMRKCNVMEPPLNRNQAKSYKTLDWHDDSYLIYPYSSNSNDHQHIISCYVFTEKFVEKIMNMI